MVCEYIIAKLRWWILLATYLKLLLRSTSWIAVILTVVVLQIFSRTILSSLSWCWEFVISQMQFFISILMSHLFVSSLLCLNLSLLSIAGIFSMINNKEYDHHRSFLVEVVREKPKPKYDEYTVEKYNETISALFDRKAEHFIDLAGFSTIFGILLPGGAVINTLLDSLVNGIKFSWALSTPHVILQNVGLLTFKKDDFLIGKDRLRKRISTLRGKNIIFMLPTNGRNLKTVAKSAGSVIYWSEIIKTNFVDVPEFYSWIVCEEDNYVERRASYEELRSMGCRIIVVPRTYKTRKGTQYKARALMYALEIMDQEGLSTEDTWIYHQDDETMIGEDTILGVIDFISTAGPRDVYAAGMIIYADGWDSSVSTMQEPARTYDDLRIMVTTRTRGLLSFGHHGSHLLVRADVERRIGWDFGKIKTEDWLFGLKLWQDYSPEKTVLKGFAYEKPPLNARDLIKQRRRWAQGALQIIRRRDIRPRYRLAALYGVISWLSAFPSLVAFVLNIINPTGGLFVGSGVLAGFTWFSLYRYYGNGYVLNKPYFRNYGEDLGSRVRRTFIIIGGMLLESIAPWFALLRPTKNFEVIKKDGEVPV
ncbi:MAG: glycosyltransferase family 2 protein [Nitrososphaerota archaeon]